TFITAKKVTKKMARLYHSPTILLCFNCFCLVILIYFEGVDKLRDDIKRIFHDVLISNSKKGSLWIAIDYHTSFVRAYSCKVLDSTRNADRDVEVWTYG